MTPTKLQKLAAGRPLHIEAVSIRQGRTSSNFYGSTFRQFKEIAATLRGCHWVGLYVGTELLSHVDKSV